MVQAITNQFWKIWIKIYFPTLLIRHKWHTSRRNVRVDDLCLLQEDGAFRSEWKMAKVVEVYPDKVGTVRNVQVLVKPNQDGSSKYKPLKGYEIKRHVSKLLVLVPAEEQDIVDNDDEVKDAIFDTINDDVCDSVTPDRGSSYNSPKKQEDVHAMLEEEVDEEPGGNVAASRRSPRFKQSKA